VICILARPTLLRPIEKFLKCINPIELYGSNSIACARAFGFESEAENGVEWRRGSRVGEAWPAVGDQAAAVAMVGVWYRKLSR
jgi:hypothetical protein